MRIETERGRMETLTAYKDHLRQIGKLESALALLHWDQRTNLPEQGKDARAEVIGELSKRAFALSISDELGHYLEELNGQAGLSSTDAASVRVVGKVYRRHRAISPELYERFAIARSKSETAWEKARESSDFSLFQPHLEAMVDFARQFAKAYGYEENPYDALIEEYEPGMRAAELNEIIDSLRQRLVPFITRLMKGGKRPDTGFLSGDFSLRRQRELSLKALTTMGYDFTGGRLDTTVHPFTITTGPGDVRVTTRFIEGNLLSGLFSSMHEGGHALYEQGIPARLHWSGLESGASYGLHESQSRLWENMIGRSLAFWTFFQPLVAGLFPDLSSLNAEQLYRAANVVSPSLIRVEADEVTYNLHIMLRFELEEALINGEISVSELPQRWRAAMEDYLGIVPDDDAHGVLQDVHWSAGMFGYFPSYMLGNLYSAQIFDKMKQEIDDVEDKIAGGEFAELRSWLREKIHRFGKIYEPKELIERCTGAPPDPSYFIRYITEKYSEVYCL